MCDAGYNYPSWSPVYVSIHVLLSYQKGVNFSLSSPLSLCKDLRSLLLPPSHLVISIQQAKSVKRRLSNYTQS